MIGDCQLCLPDEVMLDAFLKNPKCILTGNTFCVSVFFPQLVDLKGYHGLRNAETRAISGGGDIEEGEMTYRISTWM